MITQQASTRQLRGFSLLEIMVALALMAMSFTALILVQGRATNVAVQARNLSTATMLARYQLRECQREAQKFISAASDFKQDGNFTELGFERYTWECHAPKFNMKAPSASQVEQAAKANTPDQTKQQGKTASASAMSPVITLVTDTLGNSVRELVVIVRWTEGVGEDNTGDEIRVVTHIVDLAAMQMLAKMLKEGSNQLDKKNTKDQPAQPAQPGPTGPPGPPPPGFNGGGMGPGAGGPPQGGMPPGFGG